MTISDRKEKAMFNIFDFIDSPDIREMHKNTVFAPSEQAVIIYHNLSQSVEDKILALKFLVNNFSEEEFHSERIAQFRHKSYKNTSLRKIVNNIADTWKKALDLRYNNDGTVFLAEISNPDNTSCTQKYFSDYDSAFKFICSHKSLTPQRIEITRTPVNMDFQDYASFFFTKDFILYSMDIYPGDDYFYNFAISIPIPFKAGDILKVDYPFQNTIYGVIHDENLISKNKYNDNMNKRLEIYDRKNNRFGSHNINSLHLQKVSPEELPSEHNYLKLMSDIIRQKLDPMDFISYYSKGRMDQFADSYNYLWD